jgi:hypothetical protein
VAAEAGVTGQSSVELRPPSDEWIRHGTLVR